MATAEPRRRRGDGRGPARPILAPTPGQLGPADPAATLRSISDALESARRARRPLTLVALALGGADAEGALARLADIVRRTVRAGDALWRDGEDGLLLMLADVDGPGCEPALARLRLRLRRDGLREARMGRAAPAPGIAAPELIALARSDRRPIA